VKKLVSAVVLAFALAGLSVPGAQAVGPGGWDRLGSGGLNGDVLAMSTDLPGQLLVAGKFTTAGAVANTNRIASWNGTSWSSLGPASGLNGDVFAVAVHGGKIYAGGVFTDAGGDLTADHLAVWNGSVWAPFCNGTGTIGGNVKALEVIGNTLFVGGEFQDGGGLPLADYMLACDLTTGDPSVTTADPVDGFAGPVYALASQGAALYAGGNFQNLEDNIASDFVAEYSGGVWTNLGSSSDLDGSVTGIVRSLAANETGLYVGSDGLDIDEIAAADHVARWNGAWSALGTVGYIPTSASVDALHANGADVYASGNWLDAGGDPRGDHIARFDGTSWGPIGSNGAGGGPLTAKGEALTTFGGVLHAGGNFTSAGGDPSASFIAKYTPLPSNTIAIGKVKRNKSKGSAVASVVVPGPGALTAGGKATRRVEKSATGPGTVRLKIKPDKKTMAKLLDKGSVKVKVKFFFTPTGGVESVTTKRIKLVLKPG
jgi:hypothetical protein